MNARLVECLVPGLIALWALLPGCASLVEVNDAPAVVRQLSPNTRLVSVTGREGATQPFLVINPPQVQASVILFAGGDGYLGLDESGGIRSLSGNFLVKMRNTFVQQGMLVALVDTPSDRNSLDRFRSSRAHAVDIRAVIRWLHQQAHAPVWLVGTSRGTISTAAVAAQLDNEGPDGIVLTSTLFGPSRNGTVFNADLKAIRLPVLLVHHKNDGCSATPYRSAAGFTEKISAATKVELITIEGGSGNIGDVCGAKSAHGFLGLETEVVGLISDWIKAN